MNRFQTGLLFFFVLCILTIDFLSKRAVYLHFTTSYGGVPLCVFKEFYGISFYIDYVANRGAAWGLLSSMQLPLLILRCAFVCGMGLYLFLKKISFYQRFALMLILSGALGNIIDFFIYGYVVDLFHFNFFGHSFPVFNIADSSITCGIALLAGHYFLAGKEKKQFSLKS
jgi:signal peptidase II